MADPKVRGGTKLTSSNSEVNALALFVNQMLASKINTAEIVKVVEVDANGSSGPTGTVNVLPLICHTDAWNNAIQPATIYRLPYFRVQGGIAATVIDPAPGDIGIAVFTKRDSSGVTPETSTPIQPASFRSFDLADGFYFGGFLNRAPDAWLKIDSQTGEIDLSTKAANIGINIRESGDISIKTKSGNVSIQATDGGKGTITLDGQVLITRTIQVLNKYNETSSQFSGGFNNIGGNSTSNGVTLETHTHSGVDPGSGNTGQPNP